MSAEVAAVLRRMRERLATPERWTQGDFARDALGKGIEERHPAAVCWCLYGARNVETQDHTTRMNVADLIQATAQQLPGEFNDTHEHAEVLALLDKAIATAEAA